MNTNDINQIIHGHSENERSVNPELAGSIKNQEAPVEISPLFTHQKDLLIRLLEADPLTCSATASFGSRTYALLTASESTALSSKIFR